MVLKITLLGVVFLGVILTPIRVTLTPTSVKLTSTGVKGTHY